MGYDNPLHGLDSHGEPATGSGESVHGATLPRVTDSADPDVPIKPVTDRSEQQPVTVAATEDAGTVVTVDLGYLFQQRHEATGEEGGRDRSMWVDLHPADPCVAATGVSIDLGSASRCHIHPDGAHRCRRTPEHQGTSPDEPAPDPRRSRADHICVCSYVWCSADGGVATMTEKMATSHNNGRIRGGSDVLARVLSKLADSGMAEHDGAADFREIVREVGDEFRVIL